MEHPVGIRSSREPGIRVAAPTAILASMAGAARQGVVIKSGRHIEQLAAMDTLTFDKTGTLTRGVPPVVDVGSHFASAVGPSGKDCGTQDTPRGAM
jgi:hypothetical protein